MSPCIKSKVAVVLCVAAASFAGCAEQRATYDALFIGLPREVSVKKAQFSLIYYILTQTHEPLFRKDDGENFTSRLLVKWSRSIDSKAYHFCPDPALKFSPTQAFDGNYFAEYINGVTERFSRDFTMTREGDRFTVRFHEPEKNYLEFLTLLDNAPTLRRTDSIEDGLGPFYVESLGDSKVVLKRKKMVRRGYNEIIMWEYNGTSDARLSSRDVEDFNLIYSYQVPDWVKREYTAFDIMDLKSIGLVLNHPDQTVRTLLYNCVDIDAFREAFYPNKSGFQYIRTILPMGIPGAETGRPAQNCRPLPLKNRSIAPIIFADWRDDGGGSHDLSAFWEKFQRHTGLRVIIRKYTVREVGDCLDKGKNKIYNLLPVAIDTSGRNDPLAFFDIFVGRRFFDFIDPGIEKKYVQMLSEADGERKRALSGEIDKKIADKAMILPLYQSVSKLHYPTYIRNITVGRKISRYPEIGDFRW